MIRYARTSHLFAATTVMTFGVTTMTLCSPNALAQELKGPPYGSDVVRQEVERGKPNADASRGSRPAVRSGQSRAQQVTLTLRDSTIAYTLRALAKQARIGVAFDQNEQKLQRRISVDVHAVSLMQAVNVVLKGTGFIAEFSPGGEMLIIQKGSVRDSTMTQDSVSGVGTIAGRIMDSATGRPIEGATISVVGQGQTAMSDKSGAFRIPNVRTGAHVVTAKLLGYGIRSAKVVVKPKEGVRITISLPPSSTVLSEVVTSVTGQQRKVEIGNDVTTINVDSVMQVAPITSVTDLLETRVPGLTVTRSSGVPGAPSRIRIRGIGGGLLANQPGAPTNDPIVIVDGIRIHASQSGVDDKNLAVGNSSAYPSPSPIDQIDPNSIEKIEVMKGPSAAALYGSDAANGVIMITTKRGRAGPTRWSATVNQNVEYLPGFYAPPGYYPFCDDGRGLLGSKKRCDLGLFQRGAILDSVVRFQALNEPRLTAFGTGHREEVSGTVSGGTSALTYSMTGSVSNELGLLKMPALYQDLFKTLFDSAPGEWMRCPNIQRKKGFNATVVAEPHRGIQMTLTTRLTSGVNRQSSGQTRLDELSTMYLDTMNLGDGAVQAFAERVTANSFVADYSLQANLTLLRILPLTGTIGYNRGTRDYSQYEPALTKLRRNRYAAGTSVTGMNTARVNGTLFPGQRLTTALGVEVNQKSMRQFSGKADSVPDGVIVPSTLNAATQNGASIASGGWFVEPRLNLNSRFFVNPGFRIDGNSTSGTKVSGGGSRGLWSLFPRLNFSYLAIDREGRAPMFNVITMFRPRLALGVAGVQPGPAWNLRLLAPPASSGDSTLERNALQLSTLGNTQLHPERTREVEAGFDLDLWDGRMSLSITKYHKMRLDAIERLPVAPSVYGGYLEQYQNIGRVRNTGTELTVSTILVESPIVQWAVNFSLSKNENRLMSLNSEQAYISVGGDGTRLIAGYPLFGRWARPILGYAPNSSNGRLTTNDVIVADSAVYVGQQTPNFELPFNTSVSLFRGRVSFNATFQYKDGLTQFNRGGEGVLNNLYFNPNATLAEQAAALSVQSCDDLIYSYSGGEHCTNYGLIQTVNVLRFTAVSIGYTVPKTFSQRMRVSSMTVSVQGSNLGLWSSYRGKDPDVNGQTVGDATVDTGVLPQPRTWRLQVRISN